MTLKEAIEQYKEADIASRNMKVRANIAFGNWLLQARKERGLSCKSLARNMGILNEVVSRIEKGSEAPTEDFLRELKNHL